MKTAHEAFVYLWYDALNKMYYLGSSIGKDPNYAHSSSVMEPFTMNTKPAHMHRKILDKGTHEEMLALESELQANRKERCWDRYYNVNVCEPFYGGFGSRENHPRWIDGRKCNDPVAYMKEYMKEYQQTPEYKAYKKEYDKEYQQTPKYKTYDKKRKATPEYRAYQKEYMKEYRARKKAERQGEGTLKEFI